MAEKLTIRDIARLAGVSAATVSRVLNDKPDVDPLTRERVMLVMKERGFSPDPLAVQLASGPLHKNQHGTPVFPTNFFWGVATSAYQIEGATQEDGRGPSIWDTFVTQSGATYKGETGDIAVDHYHSMRQDIALMASLNVNAYRFSLSWSRILPQGVGTVNERGLDFYERLVDTLLSYAITPVITLYHWDLPHALHERGGWLNRDTAHAFADYAELAAQRLGDRVAWWITLNEPWCSAYLGYGIGMHAPGLCDMQSAMNSAHHLLLAHGLALPRLHSQIPQARVGIALNLTPVSAADDNEVTLQGVQHADIFHNRWFLDPLFRGVYPQQLFDDLAVNPPPIKNGDMTLISTPLDFLGVNYYSRSLIRTKRNVRANGSGSVREKYEQVAPVPGATYTEMAWEIYPRGVQEVLLRVYQDYAPPLLLITENGAAFEDQWDGGAHITDKRRVLYLREHIQMLEEVLKRGVPVRGYFAWSFLDNFEWTDGYSKRFGLVYVDYATQRRIVKDSGHWYASFIAEQRLNRALYKRVPRSMPK